MSTIIITLDHFYFLLHKNLGGRPSFTVRNVELTIPPVGDIDIELTHIYHNL